MKTTPCPPDRCEQSTSVAQISSPLLRAGRALSATPSCLWAQSKEGEQSARGTELSQPNNTASTQICPCRPHTGHRPRETAFKPKHCCKHKGATLSSTATQTRPRVLGCRNTRQGKKIIEKLTTGIAFLERWHYSFYFWVCLLFNH